MFLTCWLNIIIYIGMIMFPGFVKSGAQERRLLETLLKRYNKLERPVLNETDLVEVNIGLNLQQILDIDETKQILTTNSWLNLAWTDENLRWNSSEFGGMTSLRIDSSLIWIPDLKLYNSADEKLGLTYQTMAVVYSDGKISYIPPAIFRSSCKSDITWFPFDKQQCDLKFGSWTYNGFLLDIQLNDDKPVDVSSYISNQEWKLLETSAKRNENYYACCYEPYQDLTFTISLQRRSLYYFCRILLPCLLFSSLAVLVFLLPTDSAEKLFLSEITLLSLTIFQTAVSENIPKTSTQTSLLGTYFNCLLIMTFTSVVASVILINFNHKSQKMPKWIEMVFLKWISKLICLPKPEISLKAGTLIEHTEYQQEMRNDILEGVTDEMTDDKETKLIMNDWKFAAVVLDRLCLVISLLFTAVSITIVVLSAAP